MTKKGTLPSTYPTLVALRDKLAELGSKTCKIGLEANMTPSDYPIIRLVTSRVTPAPVRPRRVIDLLIYYGQPSHDFDAGLEALTESHMAMEAAIIEIVEDFGGRYIETVSDEDRLDGYKMMSIRVQVQG